MSKIKEIEYELNCINEKIEALTAKKQELTNDLTVLIQERHDKIESEILMNKIKNNGK
jgi:hypothetical protein